ncbi:MAG: DUF1801 domain-containing protein [Ignavibacteriae bacterium]|nr:DUF1801 domain-containing protein [Ignavibacteriota bacterium]
MKDNRTEIFQTIKRLLKEYEPPLVAKSDFDSRYELYSPKGVIIAGRKKSEVWFAGLIIQSNYVGFYFMPVYTNTELKQVFKKELLSTLKGKSCFHIKTLDANLTKQIKEAIEHGYKLYKKRGWI